jgi:beta-galactosidase
MRNFGLVALLTFSIFIGFPSINKITAQNRISKSAINYSINENWFFLKGDQKDNEKESVSDQDWEIVSFPHTWNNQDAVDEKPGFYRGICWYRRAIFIGIEGKDKQIYIHFEGANQEVELYVNEKKVGGHSGGYTAFNFNITSFVTAGKSNLFAIKVSNEYNKSIPPLSADFTFFGGIYRNVSLAFYNTVHFSKDDFASSGIYIKTSNVSQNKATVNIQSLLKNELFLSKATYLINTIISPNGEIVAVQKVKSSLAPNEAKKIESKSIDLINPQLWSPEHPNLYKVISTIIDKETNAVVDAVATSFGIRWFEFTASDGFFINDKPLKLIGVNRHECYDGMGNALRDEIQAQDIYLAKQMGANFLRLAHYPQNQEILNLCDQLGIVTIVEAPIVNAITEGDAFLNTSLQMVTEMVKQNCNHSSIVSWSYMNEVLLRLPYKNDAEKHALYCKEVHRQAVAIEKLIRELDPNRYTIIPCHGSLNTYKEAQLLEVPKLIGWNLYQGWYSDNLNGFDDFLDNFHKEYPKTPFIISEYGADVDVRLHSFQPERFDYTSEYANLYHEHYLKSIMERKFVSGALIWNLNDFYSEYRGNAVPHVNNKGITGLNREIKNTYLLYQAHLLIAPFLSFGDKNWMTRAGVETSPNVCLQSVLIYSNQLKIEVFHNGNSIGEYQVQNGVVSVNVSFINGNNTLSVISKDNKNAIDFMKIDFSVIPLKFTKSNFSDLNVILGSNRLFEDRVSKICWIPEQEYTNGSWGYIGGEPLKPKTKNGVIPASDLDIYGTTQDPIFQTQRVGLKEFKADVPDGEYEIYCYWAHLVPTSEKEGLVNNLGNSAIYDTIKKYNFDLSINDEMFLKNFDIPSQIGVQKAIIKKIKVNISDGKGILLKFTPIDNSIPYLNAIRIVKIF